MQNEFGINPEDVDYRKEKKHDKAEAWNARLGHGGGKVTKTSLRNGFL